MSYWMIAVQATREDVFKSISDNLSHNNAGSQKSLLGFLLGGVGVVLLLALFNLRNTRQAVPKALNHRGKLLKELKRKIGLRNAELKQLKILAELPTETGVLAEHPLVLVLCPSLLNKAMQTKPPRVDRKVILSLARKMGLMKK